MINFIQNQKKNLPFLEYSELTQVTHRKVASKQQILLYIFFFYYCMNSLLLW